MIKDSLWNKILLTNIWYYTPHLERVYKYHKIAASDDGYRVFIDTDTVSQSNCY